MTTPAKRLRRRIGWVVLYLAAATAILLLVFTVMQIRVTQRSSVQTVKSSAKTLDVVEDCTQPNGKCFRRGQRQTASAVQTITEVQTQAAIFAAYCVRQDPNSSVAQIERCVKRQFAIDKR